MAQSQQIIEIAFLAKGDAGKTIRAFTKDLARLGKVAGQTRPLVGEVGEEVDNLARFFRQSQKAFGGFAKDLGKTGKITGELLKGIDKGFMETFEKDIPFAVAQGQKAFKSFQQSLDRGLSGVLFSAFTKKSDKTKAQWKKFLKDLEISFHRSLASMAAALVQENLFAPIFRLGGNLLNAALGAIFGTGEGKKPAPGGGLAGTAVSSLGPGGSGSGGGFNITDIPTSIINHTAGALLSSALPGLAAGQGALTLGEIAALYSYGGEGILTTAITSGEALAGGLEAVTLAAEGTAIALETTAAAAHATSGAALAGASGAEGASLAAGAGIGLAPLLAFGGIAALPFIVRALNPSFTREATPAEHGAANIAAAERANLVAKALGLDEVTPNAQSAAEAIAIIQQRLNAAFSAGSISETAIANALSGTGGTFFNPAEGPTGADGVGRFLQKPSLRLVGEAGPEHILNVDSGPSIRALTEGIRPIIRELFEEERRGGCGTVVNVDLRGSFFPDSRSVEKLFRLLEDFRSGRRVSRGRFA